LDQPPGRELGHLQVMGRGRRIAMLDRLATDMARRPGVATSTMRGAAKTAARQLPECPS
jgi:hypothetical protein